SSPPSSSTTASPPPPCAAAPRPRPRPRRSPSRSQPLDTGVQSRGPAYIDGPGPCSGLLHPNLDTGNPALVALLLCKLSSPTAASRLTRARRQTSLRVSAWSPVGVSTTRCVPPRSPACLGARYIVGPAKKSTRLRFPLARPAVSGPG